MDTIGTRIQRARKLKKWKQIHLQAETGKSIGTIRNWEGDKVRIDDGDIHLLASLLDVSAYWLRTGEGEMRESDEPEEDPLELLQEIMDTMPVAMALFDTEIRWVAYNAEYLRMWGFPPETDLRGKLLWEVFGDVSGGGPEKFRIGLDEPMEWERDDGTSTYLRVRMEPWRRGSDAISGAIIICSAGSTPQEAADIRAFGIKGVKFKATGSINTSVNYVSASRQDSTSDEDDMETDYDIPASVLRPITEAAHSISMDPRELKRALRSIKQGGEVHLRVILEPKKPDPKSPS